MRAALILAAALAPAVLSGPAQAQQRIPAGTQVLWPAQDLKWEVMPGLPGAMQARLWGDPTQASHGILYKWKAGTDVPVHTHTHGDRGVIVSGVLTLAVEGAPAKAFPAGSYFSLAGGVKHATGCKKGRDCVFFIEREGPFDANLVKP